MMSRKSKSHLDFGPILQFPVTHIVKRKDDQRTMNTALCLEPKQTSASLGFSCFPTGSFYQDLAGRGLEVLDK